MRALGCLTGSFCVGSAAVVTTRRRVIRSIKHGLNRAAAEQAAENLDTIRRSRASSRVSTIRRTVSRLHPADPSSSLMPSTSRHTTYIPSSLIMKPMAIAGGPPTPRSSPTLYQRFRQRTPILVAFVAVLIVLVVHSVPRRKALINYHDSQNGALGREGDADATGTPQHDTPYRDDELQPEVSTKGLGAQSSSIDQIDAAKAVESATTVPIIDGVAQLGSDGKYDDLPYLHCGPEYGSSANPGGGIGRELVLLHGAAFRAKTWSESGILQGLCLLGASTSGADPGAGGDLSVTALDLPVSADAVYLENAFQALRKRGLLSSESVYLVTPSASGASVVDAATLASDTNGGEDLSKLLKRLIRGWIPVASFAVLTAADVALQMFAREEVPVLAIYGDKDNRGKQSSERLAELSNARMLELEGRHPCYLDSPDVFVRSVLEFIDSGGRFDG